MRPLLIVLLFVSCNNSNWEAHYFDSKTSKEKLDTVKAMPYIVTSKPEIFETAFFTGASKSYYSVNIGNINIESGKIIACDPIVMHDATPFSQTFPIGQFPVQLAITKINTDERVAFSRILFSDSAVAKWEFALHDGQKPIPIGGETLYGYGVDGGIGLFIDKVANDAFKTHRDKDEKFWDGVFIYEMDKHYRDTWEYALYNFDSHNLASFSTGYGDGTYGTYVGYDSKGNICRLLTDFGLIEWWTTTSQSHSP